MKVATDRPNRLFLLIDPWLTDTGGHNFQYALDVAGSAQQRGYDVVLAVNKDLPPALRFPDTWCVMPLFRFGPCARHWLGPIGRNRHPCDIDGAWLQDDLAPRSTRAIGGWGRALRRWLDWPAAVDRRRRILDFVHSARRLFERFQPTSDDVVFLPSMSEFDFLGVARFLRDDARTLAVAWHLQFHFNVFLGREPEYDEQAERLARFRLQLGAARRQIPHHRLHFYATTPSMARQFNHVGIDRFDPLPYPVRKLADKGLTATAATAGPPLLGAECHEITLHNGSLPVARRHASNGNGECGARTPPPPPLRVTFAGAMRREKGKKKLGALIASVWPDCLATGRMQFVFQSTPRNVASWLSPELRRLARIAAACGDDPTAPLLTAGYPLDAESYTRLLQQSDLGVFLYDSRRYYARASGILCEMLAGGVPVIVPAGCWLSDQIAEDQFCHVRRLASRQDHVLATWERELCAHGDDSCGELCASCRLPESASDLAVQWQWPEHWPAGSYVQVSAEFVPESDGAILASDCGIVGPGERELPPATSGNHVTSDRLGPSPGLLFPVARSAQHVRVRIRSAYRVEPLALQRVQITALRAPPESEHHPRGGVGLIAANEEQVPQLIREIHCHYRHYQQMAHEFSAGWLQRHHADRTLDALEASDSSVLNGH